MQLLLTLPCLHFAFLLLRIHSLQAAIMPLSLVKSSSSSNNNNNNNILHSDTEKIGYFELKPNGTLILQQAAEQSGNNSQNLLLLHSVLNALKLSRPADAKWNIKIYGEGVEHKFPPLVENVIQRIQTYFSVYRYTDTSRPVRKEATTTTTERELAVGNAELTTLKMIEELTDLGNEDAYIIVGED